MQTQKLSEPVLSCVMVQTVRSAHGVSGALASTGARVLRLTFATMNGAAVAEALESWAVGGGRSVALVVPDAMLPVMRSLAIDMADQGVVVGVFSERDLHAACQHALREQRLARACAAAAPDAAVPRRHPAAPTIERRPQLCAPRSQARKTAAGG